MARDGAIWDRRGGARGRPFARQYSGADIRLLAEVDEAFEQMSGLATREILSRQYEVFGDPRFERLATISNGHIYNLRASSTYCAKRTVWTKTRAVTVSIGLRQAPQPDGRPGHVRVDTVHQGDRDGEKGVYLINLVDEVTQFEFVGAVVGISERFLVPLLEGLLLSFPFPILGFHADNGSEYINHRVAALLEKLRVGRFTKSRARHSNDNALVEGKNANVIRKWFGHDHIPQRLAPKLNRFAQATLSPFLNFHRPCLFATEYRDGQEDSAKVPRRARHDALRQTPQPDRRRALPQTRCPLCLAGRHGNSGDRPGGGSARAGRAARAVPAHRRRQHGRPSGRMMGGGWRHQEAEPSCGFVDESFGPAHALRAVWTARGQRARRALPTA